MTERGWTMNRHDDPLPLHEIAPEPPDAPPGGRQDQEASGEDASLLDDASTDEPRLPRGDEEPDGEQAQEGP